MVGIVTPSGAGGGRVDIPLDEEGDLRASGMGADRGLDVQQRVGGRWQSTGVKAELTAEGVALDRMALEAALDRPLSPGLEEAVNVGNIVFSSDETNIPEVVDATGTNNSGTTSKPGFTGTAGTVQVGDFQDRLYGPDGKPETDIDWDGDHEGEGRPHAHDWVDGGRGRARPVSGEELQWSGGRRDPETGRLSP